MNDVPHTIGAVTSGIGRDARRDDPSLRSMLLDLIGDSYLLTGTLTEFAAEVLQVIAYVVTVPVAFTEGFLRAYLAIERVETDDDRVTIVPRSEAGFDDMVRDVDDLTADIDPGAVFNPVVRVRLDAAHRVSGPAMQWDLDTLSRMDDRQLMEVLRQMQAESEAADPEADDSALDSARTRLATVRRNVLQFQARQRAAGGNGGHDAVAQAGGSAGD